MAATLGSTILGFGREMINARYYGAHQDMDAFLAAATIPTILFGAFNGALLSALIPTFTAYLARNEESDLWRLASTVINLLAIALLISALIGYVLAPWYVPRIAHGFGASELTETITMTRWLMPTILATSLAGVVSALLNAYHRFSATAIQGVAINVVTLLTVMLSFHRLGIFALVLGTGLGIIAQLVVQLPSFFSMRKFRLCLDIRHPGFRSIASAIGPILVGSAAGQIALFFDRYFASTLPVGYMAGMNYAMKLANFPQQIFAAAIATVLFPLLASHFAADNRLVLRSTISMGLRVVFFVMIPSVCGLFILGEPIVRTLFERGAFQASATQLTAGLLPFCVVGLFALAANVVLTRCAFACNKVRNAVAISIFTVIANVALSLLWLPSLGARGLLLANSVSQTMQALLLLVMVSRIVGGLEWRQILRSLVSVATAAASMAFALRWIQIIEPVAASPLERTEFLLGQLLIGAAIFIVVLRILSNEELPIIYHLVAEKFRRDLPSAPENRESPIA